MTSPGAVSLASDIDSAPGPRRAFAIVAGGPVTFVGDVGGTTGVSDFSISTPGAVSLASVSAEDIVVTDAAALTVTGAVSALASTLTVDIPGIATFTGPVGVDGNGPFETIDIAAGAIVIGDAFVGDAISLLADANRSDAPGEITVFGTITAGTLNAAFNGDSSTAFSSGPEGIFAETLNIAPVDGEFGGGSDLFGAVAGVDGADAAGLVTGAPIGNTTFFFNSGLIGEPLLAPVLPRPEPRCIEIDICDKPELPPILILRPDSVDALEVYRGLLELYEYPIVFSAIFGPRPPTILRASVDVPRYRSLSEGAAGGGAMMRWSSAALRQSAQRLLAAAILAGLAFGGAAAEAETEEKEQAVCRLKDPRPNADSCSVRPTTEYDTEPRGLADLSCEIQCSGLVAAKIYRLSKAGQDALRGVAWERQLLEFDLPAKNEALAAGGNHRARRDDRSALDGDFDWWRNSVKRAAGPCDGRGDHEHLVRCKSRLVDSSYFPLATAESRRSASSYFAATVNAEDGSYLVHGFSLAAGDAAEVISGIEDEAAEPCPEKEGGVSGPFEFLCNEARRIKNDHATANLDNIASYATHMAEAYFYDSVRDHVSAARHYRLALSEQREAFGGLYAPRTADAMLGLGLQLIYLEKFIEGDIYLALATRLLIKGGLDGVGSINPNENCSKNAEVLNRMSTLTVEGWATATGDAPIDGVVRALVTMSVACAVRNSYDEAALYARNALALMTTGAERTGPKPDPQTSAINLACAGFSLRRNRFRRDIWDAEAEARRFKPTIVRDNRPVALASPESSEAEGAIALSLNAAVCALSTALDRLLNAETQERDAAALGYVTAAQEFLTARSPSELKVGVARVDLAVQSIQSETSAEAIERALQRYRNAAAANRGPFGDRARAFAELDAADYYYYSAPTSRAADAVDPREIAREMYERAFDILLSPSGAVLPDRIEPYLDMLVAEYAERDVDCAADEGVVALAENIFALMQKAQQPTSNYAQFVDFGARVNVSQGNQYRNLRVDDSRCVRDSDKSVIEWLGILEIRIAGYERALAAAAAAGPRGNDRFRGLEKSLSNAQTAYAQAQQCLSALGVDRRQLQAEMASITDIQRALEPGEVLLHVTPMAGAAYTMYIEKRGACPIVRKSQIAGSEVEEAVRIIRESVDKVKQIDNEKLQNALPEKSWFLYDRLLRPHEPDGLLEAKRLVHIAKGPLSTIPFDLLLTDEKSVQRVKRRQYRQAAWLLTQGPSLFVAPSAVSFVSVRARQTPTRNGLYLGFGGVGAATLSPEEAFQASICFWEKDDKNQDKNYFLRYIKEASHKDIILGDIKNYLNRQKVLVSKIKRIYGSEASLLNSDELDKSTVIKQLRESSRKIVHFASHGLLPGKTVCRPEPSIVLNKPERTDGDKQARLFRPARGNEDNRETEPDELELASNDRLLTTSDIIRAAPINADLVLLSACDTAGGSQRDLARAYSGLVRAFMFAGAQTVAATHWSVWRDSTGRITDDFLVELVINKRTAAEAMANAKRKFLREAEPEQTHPAYWAAYAIVGNGDYQIDTPLN